MRSILCMSIYWNITDWLFLELTKTPILSNVSSLQIIHISLQHKRILSLPQDWKILIRCLLVWFRQWCIRQIFNKIMHNAFFMMQPSYLCKKWLLHISWIYNECFDVLKNLFFSMLFGKKQCMNHFFYFFLIEIKLISKLFSSLFGNSFSKRIKKFIQCVWNWLLRWCNESSFKFSCYITHGKYTKKDKIICPYKYINCYVNILFAYLLSPEWIIQSFHLYQLFMCSLFDNCPFF